MTNQTSLIMNYLTQINCFWDEFNKFPDGKPYHVTLYYALLHINNKTGWKETFRVNYQTILDLTHLSPKTYYKACNWLFSKGFLKTYRKGQNQYQSALFGIKVLCQKYQSKGNAQTMQVPSKSNILKLYKQEKTIKNKQQEFFKKIFEFFEENGLDTDEAKKFINYNTARNWKGISDWRPIAENWILNIREPKKVKNEDKRSNKNSRKGYNQEAQDYSSFFEQ